MPRRSRTLIKFHGAETVAAVIAEPVASGPGAVMPDPIYWQMLREICTRHGVLLIADEVITGFGRTGKMFAVEHFGVVPDIMTIAKGISSSYLPLGATLATDEVAAEFAAPEGKHLKHVFTFAGHPASAAAGLKNIELIQAEGLVEHAAETGEYLSGKLTNSRNGTRSSATSAGSDSCRRSTWSPTARPAPSTPTI